MRISKHLLPAFVALLFLLLALDYGGYPSSATALVAIGVWWLVILGVLLALFPVTRLGPPVVVAMLLLLGVGLLAAFSIGWAPDPGRAFTKAIQAAALTGIFILIVLASRGGSAREWASGISAGLVLIVILAALGRFFPGLGDDVQLTRDLAGTEGRLSWPLGYWNAMGGLSAMAAAGLAWFSSNGRTRQTRALAVAGLPLAVLVLFLTSSRGGFLALVAGIGVVLLLGPGRRVVTSGLVLGILGGGLLVFAATRMPALLRAEDVPQADSEGLMLFGLTVLTILVVGGLRYLLDPRLSKLGPFDHRPWKYGVAVLAALALLVALNPVERVENFAAIPEKSSKEEGTTTDHLLSTTGSGRAQIWEPAIQAFSEDPILGIGAGGFETYYLTNREVSWIAKHSHSLPLQIGAELGLVGVLLVISFLMTALIIGIKKWREGRATASVELTSVAEDGEHPPWQAISLLGGIALAGIVSMSVDWSAEFPVVSGGVLACLALVIGPATEPARRVPVEGSRTLGERVLVALLIPVGLVFLWGGITSLRVETKLDASRAAASDGELKEARTQADEAIEILPMSGTPRIQLALVEELMGKNAAALLAVNQGIERDPEKSANYLLKTRILLSLGRTEAAERAFERARRLNPNDPIFREIPPS